MGAHCIRSNLLKISHFSEFSIFVAGGSDSRIPYRPATLLLGVHQLLLLFFLFCN